MSFYAGVLCQTKKKSNSKKKNGGFIDPIGRAALDRSLLQGPMLIVRAISLLALVAFAMVPVQALTDDAHDLRGEQTSGEPPTPRRGSHKSGPHHAGFGRQEAMPLKEWREAVKNRDGGLVIWLRRALSTTMAERMKYQITVLLEASLAMQLLVLWLLSATLVTLGASLLLGTSTCKSWGDALFRAYALLHNAPGVSVLVCVCVCVCARAHMCAHSAHIHTRRPPTH